MNVIWTGGAEDDLLRHWLFVAQRNVAYAERIEARLRETGELVGSFPRIGRLVHRTTRDLSLPDIQYVVRYRLDEDAVRIIAVRSTRENRS